MITKFWYRNSCNMQQVLRRFGPARHLLFFLSLASATALAQDAGQAEPETGLQTEEQVRTALESVSESLEQLDELARQCQPALELAEPGDACRGFLAAIHGEQLLAYTSRCTEIRNWRDQQIETRLGGNPVQGGEEEAQQLLDSMMRAEYYCGQDALSKRSDVIVPVYQALDGNSQGQQSLVNLLQDLRFRQLNQQRRWQGQQAGESVRQQQRQMTDELFQRQQQELLRQEMQRQLLHQENWRN